MESNASMLPLQAVPDSRWHSSTDVTYMHYYTSLHMITAISMNISVGCLLFIFLPTLYWKLGTDPLAGRKQGFQQIYGMLYHVISCCYGQYIFITWDKACLALQNQICLADWMAESTVQNGNEFNPISHYNNKNCWCDLRITRELHADHTV